MAGFFVAAALITLVAALVAVLADALADALVAALAPALVAALVAALGPFTARLTTVAAPLNICAIANRVPSMSLSLIHI